MDFPKNFKIKQKYFLLISISGLLIAGNVMGVVLVPDIITLYLYEKGIRITDSSVLYNDGYRNSICWDGICYVLRKYESVTFYKTNKKDILNEKEWRENWYSNTEGCEDYLIEEKRWLTKDKIIFENSNEYKKIHQRIGVVATRSERKKIWDEISQMRTIYINMLGYHSYNNSQCWISSKSYQNVYIKDIINNALYSKTILLSTSTRQLGSGYHSAQTFAVDLKKGIYVEIQGEPPDVLSEQFIFLHKQEHEQKILRVEKQLVLLERTRTLLIILLLVDIIAIGFISIKNNKRRKETGIIESGL
jgi:hypothetical protein